MATLTRPKVIVKDELDALTALTPGLTGVPARSAITHIMRHGSLQSFTEKSAVAVKLAALQKRHSAETSADAVKAGLESTLLKMQAMSEYFFQSLVEDEPCAIPSSLMTYLTQPVKGKMYSEDYQPSDLPVAITFMGQFIDHDLTKNATNLVDPETGPIQDLASPYIDLDSVYGPRPDAPLTMVSPRRSDGRFVLTKLDDSNNAYDVQRTSGGAALIEDARNDENQVILQVHILIMRVHNLLMKEKGLDATTAQRETIYNWQSVVINDHQASVLNASILAEVLADLEKEVAKPGSGGVKYRPNGKELKLPHEFAIGFRYGHSQLRDNYTMGPGRSFELFNNLDPGPSFVDLRGGRPLTADRVIDWPFFIVPDQDYKKSNLLDTLVASDVFNLPESAVPDVPTQFLGNLPQRNLIRSREIGVTSGEKLFDFFFGPGAHGKLSPDLVEPNYATQGLFRSARDGFQTPLWYYVLKEAELTGGLRLGKLGSRLVGEVVGGAIYYNPVAYVHDSKWMSSITGSKVVKMKDLVDFVWNKDAT